MFIDRLMGKEDVVRQTRQCNDAITIVNVFAPNMDGPRDYPTK